MFKEFWNFIKNKKKYWVVPLILVVVILSSLLFFTQNSPLAPFLYEEY